MVRSVERCLKKSIGRSPLKFEELRILLMEIEATLNNRPLTYVLDAGNRWRCCDFKGRYVSTLVEASKGYRTA